MNRSSDSDQSHRAVSKNGHDQIQDRELRELRREMRDHEEKDQTVHEDLTRAIGRVDAALGRYVFGARVAQAFLAAGLAVAIGMVGWYTTELTAMREQIQKIDARTQVDGARGARWTQSLEEDVAELRGEIRQLREDIRELRRAFGRSRQH